MAELGNRGDEHFYVDKLDMMIENLSKGSKNYTRMKPNTQIFYSSIRLQSILPKWISGVQELIGLQNSVALKAHYEKLSVMATEQDLVDFWKAVQVTAFPDLRSFSAKSISRFGTTYR